MLACGQHAPPQSPKQNGDRSPCWRLLHKLVTGSSGSWPKDVELRTTGTDGRAGASPSGESIEGSDSVSIGSEDAGRVFSFSSMRRDLRDTIRLYIVWQADRPEPKIPPSFEFSDFENLDSFLIELASGKDFISEGEHHERNVWTVLLH